MGAGAVGLSPGVDFPFTGLQPTRCARLVRLIRPWGNWSALPINVRHANEHQRARGIPQDSTAVLKGAVLVGVFRREDVS